MGFWYMGKPGYEVHPRLETIFHMVLKMRTPALKEDKITELLGGFNQSLENWRKKHARPELKVN